MPPTVQLRRLGLVAYTPTWHAMQQFTETRTPHTPDALWLLSHPPVYTQGQAGRPEHLLNPQQIPVVQTDRGGQVTYHGPGQLVGYVLCDLERAGVSARSLVDGLEDALASVCHQLGIANAEVNRAAHGVYVAGRKVASLGLRIRRGCSYHGFSLNVAMDLSPFDGINPCGHAGLQMCQVSDFLPAERYQPATLEAACLRALHQHVPAFAWPTPIETEG